MKILLPILFCLLSFSAAAKLCDSKVINDPLLDIKMDDEWYKKEEVRAKIEDSLVKKYSEYLSKKSKPLVVEFFKCGKGDVCDELNNCQLHKDAKKYREIEYQIKTDAGVIISKSYCSKLGKCIGYNDFLHSKNVTAAEDRLIDVKKDNAIFYHYFYSANSKTSYEAPFNITNFHTGSELYLSDFPHFSPDEKFMLEINSSPENSKIAIYEANEYGEYKNIEPDEVDDAKKIVSTFLSRNLNCGKAPHFYSWKNNREVILSESSTSQENAGKKTILFYDKKAKKWACREEDFMEYKCRSYLPDSTNFISNFTKEQMQNCINL